MATTISTQDLENVRRDIDDIGKSVNEKVIVSPRYGEDFKSIPLIAKEGEEEIINLQNAIDIAAAAGAGENGWTAQLIVDESGKTQQEINDIRQVSVKDYMTQAQLQDCLSSNPQLKYSDAFQAAVDAAIANGSHSIFIPLDRGEIYNLDKTVNLNASGFELKGNRSPTYFRQTNRRGYIRADEGVVDFFNYNNGAVAGVYSSNQLTVDGVAAIGRFNRTQNFLRHDTDNNGPHRGVLFTKSSFVEFDGVLPIVTRTSGYIGAGSVVFENGCVIQGCNYASRAYSRSFNLRVAGIQSEQGAKWLGYWDGGITIADNMLEGQALPIDIETDNGSLTVRNNYFEAHTGEAIIKFRGTAPSATFNHEVNYFAHAENVIDMYRLSGVQTINSSQVYNHLGSRKSQLTFSGCLAAINSQLNGGRCYIDADTTGNKLRGYFDPNGIPLADSNITASTAIGSVAMQTPYGFTSQGHFLTGTSAKKVLSKSFEVGDCVTVCALVKIKAGDNPQMRLFGDSDTVLANISQYLIPNASDETWQVAVISYISTVSATQTRIDWLSQTGLSIAAVGVSVVPSAEFREFSSTSGGTTITGKRAFVTLFNPMVNLNPNNNFKVIRTVSIPSIPVGAKYTLDPTIISGAVVGDPVAIGVNPYSDQLRVEGYVASAASVQVVVHNISSNTFSPATVVLNIKVLK